MTIDKVNEIGALIEDLVVEKWEDKVKIKNNKTRCPKCGTGKKDTSFSINPDGGYAHCFDCGGSWKNISVVMIFRDCNWKEAIEYLADRAGLEHPNWNKMNPEEEERRNKIREKQEIIRKLYTLAADCYHCSKGGRWSGRQGCNPAGESPAASVARLPAIASAQARRAGVGCVAISHLGAGNQPSYAWCKRPGRPELGALKEGTTGGTPIPQTV